MAGVSTTNSSDIADADGVATVFNFSFFVYNLDDIKVYSVLDDVLTPISVGITKAINSSFIGGTVTFNVAPADAVGEILIRREVPYTQETEFNDITRYKETAIEEALNTIVLQVQQLANNVALCVKYNESAGVTDPTIAAPVDNTAAVFDGTTGRLKPGPTVDDIADAAENAALAKDWASKVNGIVASTDYSSRAYAIGGTGIDGVVGSSKDWASKTSAAVIAATYSAKEYAQGTQAATGGSAKNWAQQTGADVTGAAALSRSAKSWAQEDLTGATYGGSAKDWAQSGSLPDGTNKSAKSYALDAQAAAAAAAASAAEGLYRDVITITNAQSPYVPSAAQEGTLFRIDTSGGAVVINLSTLATYGQDMKFAFSKVTGDGNGWTVNRGGADTINGGNSQSSVIQWETHAIIGDSATGSWIDIVQATGIPDGAVTTNKILDDAVTNAKLADMAARTVKVNATNASANPTDLALAASQLLGCNAAGTALAAIALGTGLSMSGTTLNAIAGIQTINVQTFFTSGTYTPTSGMKFCFARVVGGGGGGRGSSNGGNAGNSSLGSLLTANGGTGGQAAAAGAGGTAGGTNAAHTSTGQNGSDTMLGFGSASSGGSTNFRMCVPGKGGDSTMGMGGSSNSAAAAGTGLGAGGGCRPTSTAADTDRGGGGGGYAEGILSAAQIGASQTATVGTAGAAGGSAGAGTVGGIIIIEFI